MKFINKNKLKKIILIFSVITMLVIIVILYK
jgi:hypothetical protein